MKLLSGILVGTLVLNLSLAPAFADAPAVPQLEGLTGAKAYLRLAPDNLYEQPQVNTPEFKQLSRIEQDELLIKDFFSKKYSPLDGQIYLSSFWFSVLAWYPIYHYSKQFFNRNNVNRFAWMSNEGQELMESIENSPISFLSNFIPHQEPGVRDFIAPYLGGLSAAQLFGGVYKSIADRYWNRVEDPLLLLEVDYIKKKRFLTVGMQKSIEAQFKSSRVDESRVGRVEDFVSTAVNLPIDTVVSEFDLKRINKLFDGYPTELRKQVESFVIQQIILQADSSKQNDVTQYRKGKRVAGFLYGPPGTGKSRYAELIARAMGLPFAKISLEGATLDDLLGRSIDSAHPTPGKIAKAMANAKIGDMGAKNMVLFIDEADRVINNQHPNSQDILPLMLKLLDPEAKSYFNPYYNSEIDISHLTVILAGNYMIEDEALKKRLFLINFPGFTFDYKNRIIWESTIPTLLKSYCQNDRYTLSVEDLTETDKQRITELVRLDQDPGFRTIESALMHYFSYLARRKYFEPDAQEPAHIQQLILDSNQELAEKRARRHSG